MPELFSSPADNLAGAPGHTVDRATPTDHPSVAPDAIVVRDLVKTYGSLRAVDGWNLTGGGGGIFAVLGPSGAGKSTPVEILEGYRRPDTGAVRVLGYDPIRQGHALKEQIGLMLQQTAL